MLTVLLQVRYHREEGKCRAGAHGPASEGVRAVAVATAAAATRGTREGGRTCAGGTNGAPGTVQTRTSEHEVSAGSTNKRGRVRTSAGGTNGAPGTVQTRTSEHEGRAGGFERAHGV